MTRGEQASEGALVPGAREVQDATAWTRPFEQLVELERQRVELERKRVESNNRRTDVAVKAIAASDAADKRQYEYFLERLRQGSKDHNERHRSMRKFAWAAFAVVVVAGGLLFYMLFFGDDAQRTIAQDFLRIIATAAGGGGVLWAIKSLLERMFENDRRDE